MDNWMPISATVDLMDEIGLDAASTRTAVFRLKRRGWLLSETREGARGYSLTPVALHTLAVGDEVVWHARQPADIRDGWCVVDFTIPESERSKRHHLRSSLVDLGFGNISGSTWLAPARMQTQVREAILSLGMQDFVAIFVGDYVGTRDLSTLVTSSWDIQAINERYREFVAEYEPIERTLLANDVVDTKAAFVTYVKMIDHWRKLPYRDPGLPRELLAEDWSAPQAGAVFESLRQTLETEALAHAARRWSVPVV